MKGEMLYPLAAIAVVALVTWILRAVPFALFGNRPLPRIMQYLSDVLPAAIMTILVVYCLRGTSFSSFPHGVPEGVSCLLVVLLQILRKNMYLSIVAGTVCYMILIRAMS